jgi:transcriptional regulator with XRE-family HTH domain
VPPRSLSLGARQSLAGAETYRQFLKLYFAETGLPYAEIARRAGFSSRSYPRDVTEGRRRLTAKALPSLLRGLRLDERLAQVFQSLYFLEYPEEHPALLSRAMIEARLAPARRRAARKPVRDEYRPRAAEKHAHLAGAVAEAVAALGDPEIGATLEEIRQRTGRRKSELAELLATLQADGVVRYVGDSGRYLPGSGHVNLTGLPRSEFVKAMFASAVESLKAASSRHFEREDALFVTSAVSVRSEDLPRLKREMRELLLRFVDRKVESTLSPDSVVQIVSGMFESKLGREV